MAQPLFGWYEKVRIQSTDPAKTSIQGELGAIFGMAQGDDGMWSYAVFIYNSKIVWSCFEEELLGTGEIACRESFYPVV